MQNARRSRTLDSVGYPQTVGGNAREASAPEMLLEIATSNAGQSGECDSNQNACQIARGS